MKAATATTHIDSEISVYNIKLYIMYIRRKEIPLVEMMSMIITGSIVHR